MWSFPFLPLLEWDRGAVSNSTRTLSFPTLFFTTLNAWTNASSFCGQTCPSSPMMLDGSRGPPSLPYLPFTELSLSPPTQALFLATLIARSWPKQSAADNSMVVPGGPSLRSHVPKFSIPFSRCNLFSLRAGHADQAPLPPCSPGP